MKTADGIKIFVPTIDDTMIQTVKTIASKENA